MPRAFLITHRRYNHNQCEPRESSPERAVKEADHNGGELPAASGQGPGPNTGPRPEELYNLTQLAEISLAEAAGRLFYPRHHLYGNLSITRVPSPSPVPPAQQPALPSPPSPPSLQISPVPVNTQVEPHGCPDCGKRYSTSSNLARHRQTHRSLGDKKARRCPHCDKVYVSMPAFSMHVRTHNQGCKCPYCGKCFSRPWLLQGHIRTHTGEKPFKCTVCAKAFADKSNLRAHVQTHSNTKPHVCSRCGKAFALKSYLYKHEESSCMKFHGRGPDISAPLPHGHLLGLAIAV